MSAEELDHGIQQVINDPVCRRSVADALMGQMISPTPMTKREWAERETKAMRTLGLLDEEAVQNDALRIEMIANRGGCGMNHYFIPADLTRERLIELARKVGIKIDDDPNCNGEEILTEAGVLECDLATIMNSTDGEHRPFNLNYDEHDAWALAQGGDGLTSAEETLYLMIRHFMSFGRILFMGGWIRTRNACDADCSLDVCFFAGCGLFFFWFSRSFRSWSYGAVARKFKPLAT